MNVTETVLDFFNKRGGLPGASLDDQLQCHYLDRKIIDSMGIIEMVSHFEKTFGIHFDVELLQSDEFLTVGGLISIIGRLTGKIET